MYNVEYLIPFLIKHKLTSSQFYLLHCIHNNSIQTIELYQKHFPSDNGSMIGQSATDDLLERGLLIKTEIKNQTKDGNSVAVYNYTVSKTFLEWYITPDIAIKELLRTYPNTYLNVPTSTKLYTKDIDVSETKKLYSDTIKNNVYEHLDILEDVKFATKYNLITTNLYDFVKGQKWLSVRDIRLQKLIENEFFTDVKGLIDKSNEKN